MKRGIIEGTGSVITFLPHTNRRKGLRMASPSIAPSRRKPRFCRNCSVDIRHLTRTARYCQDTCRREMQTRLRLERTLNRHLARSCDECAKPISADRSPKAIVCSTECLKRRSEGLRQAALPCSIYICEAPSSARTGLYAGLCPAHAWRKKHNKDMDAPIQAWTKSAVCSYGSCGRKVRAMTLCASHYEMDRFGLPLRPIGTKSNGRLATVEYGTQRVTKGGYIRVKTSNGWQREHTMVMEQYLGRTLLEHELVHHKNGQRDDNCIQNLELCTYSQPPGQRVSDKLEWIAKFVSDYGLQIVGQPPLLP